MLVRGGLPGESVFCILPDFNREEKDGHGRTAKVLSMRELVSSTPA